MSKKLMNTLTFGAWPGKSGKKKDKDDGKYPRSENVPLPGEPGDPRNKRRTATVLSAADEAAARRGPYGLG